MRDGWFDILNLAIDEKLIVYKGWIGFHNNYATIYARLPNVVVECDGMGRVSIKEPAGEFGMKIELVYGTPYVESIGQESDYLGFGAPELGVGYISPAALELMDELCRHLIYRLETLSSSQSEN